MNSALHIRKAQVEDLDQINVRSENIRTIDFEFDIKHIEQFIDSQKKNDAYVNYGLIKEAIRLLPDLNFVLTGKTGYYAGHCIVLPISKSTYIQLKNREISNVSLRAKHLANYKKMEQPIFYRYDITGDCNDSVFYVMAKFFRFFRDLENKDYLLCGYTERDDNYDLNLQVGLSVVWEDKALQNELNLDFPPRFVEGNFNNFLFGKE
ncbi:hypothetical protein KO566_08360 [Flavobacteriaceae bacterium XHP0103]|uniref:hypothetical protein n=1 Tax=Marixanthotalea marina TaxID=2844359 RepID=UPI002989D0F8|nr:hypothetical protein [Marixanthotalea marina]MBU3822069.1 hypothetical protein [Marixanthotalea marina]